MSDWSNLAKVVYKRTYARHINEDRLQRLENWPETVERTILGNVKGHNVPQEEVQRLLYFLNERKAGPAGRGWWFSGTPAHAELGGTALINCWFLTAAEWENFVIGMELLMLGGGVGFSVEHRYTSKLPKVKKNVTVTHHLSKDANFIVPDSRQGWCELFRRTLEAFFVTGKSFTYSTFCVRGAGEPIKGFGGTASGPLPLISFIEKVSVILQDRQGLSVRPIDAADVFCAVGEMVVAGNVRRSAILLQGDPWDKEYLKAKRWDLGPIPTQRSKANWSVNCDDAEDLHPLFWKTYEHGEPYGIVNRKNMRKYGRMGELKADKCEGVNPCVPGWTEILTDKGYIAIDKLVGQTVNVWNGFEWSSVVPKITGYNQPLVKVSLSSGQELTGTPSHEFVLQRKFSQNGYQERLKAIDLQRDDKLIKTLFPVIEKGEKVSHAYTQGFFSGDGCQGYDRFALYGVKIKLANRLTGSLVGNYLSSQDRHFFKPSVELESKDFVPFSWDLYSRLEWLAGLLDSDGVEMTEGGAQISSSDHGFLLRVQKMLTTMGTASKITLGHHAGSRMLPDGKGSYAEYECKAAYRILIGATQMQCLKELGLHCSRLKFDKHPNRDASQFTRVLSVEDAGYADIVYCFTEPKRHTGCFEGVVTGQCGEATLEPYEPCNLQELALPRLANEDEFVEAAVLMHRWGKRVTCETYHIPQTDEVIKRNRRIGTGITGCLESPLFAPEPLDKAYEAIQKENVRYSKELGIPPSIRTTVVKPSGTSSKMMDVRGEGIHGGYSRYMIQRVRFSTHDPLVTLLRDAGHHIEPEIKLDGTMDHTTLVADFYLQTPASLPVADEGWDTWKQLEAMKLAQKHWADQSVSVTVYYKREEIPKIREWLHNNLDSIKSISFLCHQDHGFKQAPKEAITAEQYEKFCSKIKPIDVDGQVADEALVLEDCSTGACPVK